MACVRHCDSFQQCETGRDAKQRLVAPLLSWSTCQSPSTTAVWLPLLLETSWKKACKPHSMRWSHAHPTWNLGDGDETFYIVKFWDILYIYIYICSVNLWIWEFDVIPIDKDILFSSFPWTLAATPLPRWVAGLQWWNSWPKFVPVELARLLFATTGGKLSLGELAVSKIPEDEDLLNVATWEVACLTCWVKKCLKLKLRKAYCK